mmetsp:Transcript_2116/g.3241  ORF Transcript_2116/g.3241 Transcript_2116/m.3241 type:complete len:561 (-) Transcript_2116:216-1898(-)
MVWVAALEAYIDITQGDIDPEKHHVRARAARLRSNIFTIPNEEWSQEYDQVMEEFMAIMAMSSYHDVLEMAQAGLDALSTKLEVNVPPMKKLHFAKTISAKDSVMNDGIPFILRPLVTSMVLPERRDVAPLPPPEHVPPIYSHYKDFDGHNLQLNGDHAKSQLYTWSTYGCIESSAVSSACRMMDVEDRSELIKGKVFVLLGAAASMSPFDTLLKLGATMICVDLPSSQLSDMMQKVATQGPEGTVMYLPVMRGDGGAFLYGEMRQGGGTPGADLIRHAPELAKWITKLLPNKRLVLCNLATSFGEESVRLAAATDLITKYVCEKRPTTEISYILSPNNVHAVTKEMAEDAEMRLHENPRWHRLFNSFPTLLVPSNTWKYPLEGTDLRILNSISLNHGSHFALGQVIKMWRAMIMYAKGHVVSANVCPPTRKMMETAADNVFFSVDFDGVQHITPIVSFDILASKSLMAALMLHDTSNENCCSNPLSSKKVAHPLDLFVNNSVHGGLWRCPCLWSSLGMPSKVMRNTVWKDPGWCPKGALAPNPPPNTMVEPGLCSDRVA